MWDLLHTCLGVCGCFCLEADFWGQRGQRPAPTSSATRRGAAARSGSGLLVQPRPEALHEVEELLLGDSADAAGGRPSCSSIHSLDKGSSSAASEDGGGALSRGLSAGSEELYRAASFNTKVTVLRSASPFFRSQQPPFAQQHQQQQQAASARAQQQHANGPAAAAGRVERGSGGSHPVAGADIELKPAPANMLLGQQHLEARGKFVDAHPVATGASAYPGSAVARRERAPSPQL